VDRVRGEDELGLDERERRPEHGAVDEVDRSARRPAGRSSFPTP
jgi:hypothetical protein